MIEPSTPPSRRTGFIATPSTPRFSSWDEIDDDRRVPIIAKNQLGMAVSTPTRAGLSHHTNSHLQASFLTPRATPQHHRNGAVKLLPGSGRQGKRLAATLLPAELKTPKTPKTPRAARPEHRIDHLPVQVSEQNKSISSIAVGPKHGITDTIRGREGMWYVFRGKPVFRPYGKNQAIPDVAPITLFPNAKKTDELFSEKIDNWSDKLQPQTLFDSFSSDSEAETDIGEH